MKLNRPSKTRAPSALTCSVCGRRFYIDETKTPPFCSERCKMVDLNRWLDEEIAVPHEGGPTKGEAVEGDDQNADDDLDSQD